MPRRILYLALVLVALGVAFGFGLAFGRLRFPQKPVQQDAILYYQDPMHPSYRSNKPGIAPDCGMQLVPVYAEDAAKSLLVSDTGAAHPLKIDSATQQLYGIRVTRVETSSGPGSRPGSIRVLGRVAADETRIYRLNLGAAGFVRETHDDTVGSHVQKDQRLAVVYSSEVLYAAAGYISGNHRVAAGEMHDFTPSTAVPASVSAQGDYLRNLGMSDAQIKELSATKKVPENIYVTSPTDGFILSRNISPGLRFEKNTEFYSIADLSHVWVIAEVFGGDASAFRPGAIARITFPDTGETFRARVSDVLPEIDPATRTLKARLELDNPGFRLRPNMFVNVELPIAMPSGITVPAEAILDSGQSKRVFVETSEGFFEPRQVETGRRLNDRVQIVKGLSEGENVVSAGTFLIDSESRLQTVAGADKAAGRRSPLVTTAVDHRAE